MLRRTRWCIKHSRNVKQSLSWSVFWDWTWLTYYHARMIMVFTPQQISFIIVQLVLQIQTYSSDPYWHPLYFSGLVAKVVCCFELSVWLNWVVLLVRLFSSPFSGSRSPLTLASLHSSPAPSERSCISVTHMSSLQDGPQSGHDNMCTTD